MPQRQGLHLLIIVYLPIGLSTFLRKAICQTAAPQELIKGCVCFCLSVDGDKWLAGLWAPVSAQQEAARAGLPITSPLPLAPLLGSQPPRGLTPGCPLYFTSAALASPERMKSPGAQPRAPSVVVTLCSYFFGSRVLSSKINQ